MPEQLLMPEIFSLHKILSLAFSIHISSKYLLNLKGVYHKKYDTVCQVLYFFKIKFSFFIIPSIQNLT